MTQELQTLSALIQMLLLERTPILSGNMMREIAIAELVEVNDYEVTFCIEAPFYDMWLWKQRGVIVNSGHSIKINGGTHTYTASHGNITDYAMWVNEVGAFGTHNKSMHWVNRVLNEAASLIPNAEVINKLELD